MGGNGVHKGRDELDLLSQLSETAAAITAATDPQEVRQLLMQASSLMVVLRQRHWQATEHLEHVRSETQTSQKTVDELYLQLANLKYQREHVMNEIRSCYDFQSLATRIELYSEEEFLQRAPPDLTKDCQDDAHKLMMNRLTFELNERKRRRSDLSELQDRKRKLTDSIAADRAFLSGLGDQLRAITKASLPVQEHLGLGISVTLKRQNLAQYLPAPLYLLYTQGVAHADAYPGTIECGIRGKALEAKQYYESLLLDADAGTGDSPAASQGDILVEHPLSVYLNFPRDSADQNGGGSSNSSSTNISSSNEGAGDNLPWLQVQFFYLPRLNIITARAMAFNEAINTETILVNMFGPDPGIRSPNPANYSMLPDHYTFPRTRQDRPYAWTQWLGGLDFLPVHAVIPSLDCYRPVVGAVDTRPSHLRRTPLATLRVQEHFADVVALVHARLRQRSQLAAVLAQLARGTVPDIIDPTGTLTPLRPACLLKSWTEITSEVYAAATQRDVAFGDQDDQPDVPGWMWVGARYFKLELTRGTAGLDGYVVIGADYPLRAPEWTVELTGSAASSAVPITQDIPADLAGLADANALREAEAGDTAAAGLSQDPSVAALEAEVNIHLLDDLDHVASTSGMQVAERAAGAGDASQVLAAQVWRVMTLFDVYNETSASAKASAGASKSQRGKLCIRPTRGRQRLRPFRYQPDLGLFVQRS